MEFLLFLIFSILHHHWCSLPAILTISLDDLSASMSQGAVRPAQITFLDVGT